MTFTVEHVGPPALDAYEIGLEHGRRARTKATLDNITAFNLKMAHKTDEYTKGFIKGLNERGTHG